MKGLQKNRNSESDRVLPLAYLLWIREPCEEARVRNLEALGDHDAHLDEIAEQALHVAADNWTLVED